MRQFLAILALVTTCAAQQVQISGGVTISGTVTTTTAPQVITPQPLNVTPAQLPSGIANSAYGLNGQGVDIAAANGTGPYTCAVTVGSLPTGLSLSTVGANTNCHIGGTPTVAGTSNFTIQVTDSKSATGTLAMSIVITSSLKITQTTVPNAVVGSAFSMTFTATGGSGGGYVFTIPNGSIPSGLSLATPTLSGTPAAGSAGTYPITVTVTDSGTNTATWSFTLTVNVAVVSGAADNRYAAPGDVCISQPADGPVTTIFTKCFYTALNGTPSPGTVRTTTAANFQATYNAANCGDVINVTAGGSVTATWVLNKICDKNHWITIQGSGISNGSFPAEGIRTSPCFSNLASLPNRPLYPCATPLQLTAAVNAALSSNAIQIQGASFHRIIGMEIGRVATPGQVYALADLSSATTQTSHIIFDRCWFHGINQDGKFPMTGATDTGTTRAISLGQSNYVAVIDSYISDIYNDGGTSANTDAQMIGGGFGSIQNSGWGVYKVVNNHCEGSSEGCIILGGSGGPALSPVGCTQGVNCNLDVPQNVEVRRNLSFAPNSWNGNTTTINALGWPNRKNGVEFKTGANILLEANVFENCWYSSQPYCYVFDFAPKNQSNGAGSPTCPSCLVQDFVARYNYGYNYPGPMMAIYSTMDIGCNTCSTLGRRGSVHDNLLGDKLNLGSLHPGAADGFEFLADAGPMTFINIVHNTTVSGYRSYLLWGARTAGNSTSGFDGIVVQNNIGTFTPASQGNAWFAGNGSTSGTCDLVTQNFQTYLNTCINGTTATWTVDHNFVFGTSTLPGWPAGNTAEATAAAMGFTAYNGGDSNLTPGNYALTGGSPGHNAASDGSDVGANITQLNSEISGVAAY